MAVLARSRPERRGIWRLIHGFQHHYGSQAIIVSGLLGLTGLLWWLGGREVGSVHPPPPALTTNLWFNLGTVALILACLLLVCVGVANMFLPKYSVRVDRYLQGTASDLADRIEDWLDEQI